MAQWFGKEIPEPLIPRMHETLSMLTDREFENGCRGVLANERFFPPLNRFIELSNPSAIEEAQEQWLALTTGSNDLTVTTKCLPPYLKAKFRFSGPGASQAREEFVKAYIHASIESRKNDLTDRRVNHELCREMERLQINASLQAGWEKPTGAQLVSDLSSEEKRSYLKFLQSQNLLEAAS